MVEEELPIFVVGMPRSGTTLISAMLTAHPNIAISPETHFLSEWLKGSRRLDVSREKDFDKFWGRFSNSSFFRNLQLDAETTKDYIRSSGNHDYRDIFSTMLRLYAQKKGKKRWGEKTPTHYAHIKQLLEWFPESRIVYMVRDPRAVVASRLSMSKKYPLSWWSSRAVDDIAIQWQYSIDILDRWINDKHIHFILYEKLIKETPEELKRLCNFIGEEYSPSMMSYDEVADDLVGKEPWKETVIKPITVESIDKWQSQLLPLQVAIIEYLTNRGMRKYQYRVFGETLGLFHKLWLNALNLARRFKRILLKTESILKKIDSRAGA
jgi:hypothetical protein